MIKSRIENRLRPQGALTDATSNYIIRNEVIPFFKKNDYTTDSSRCWAAIKATSGNKSHGQKTKTRSGPAMDWIIIFIIILLLQYSGTQKRYFFGGMGDSAGAALAAGWRRAVLAVFPAARFWRRRFKAEAGNTISDLRLRFWILELFSKRLSPKRRRNSFWISHSLLALWAMVST